MQMETIYKTPEAKTALMELYDARLRDCGVQDYESTYVETFAGRTHIIKAGNPDGPRLLVLHGIHAGAPMSLEAITDLIPNYRIIAVDTVGQATRSAETVLPLKDNSYGKWIGEVLDKLDIDSISVIGVSYGGFILQRLIAHAPERVKKAIFIVPMGMASASPFRGAFKLSVPLMQFMITKKDKHLSRFLKAFYGDLEPRDLKFQRNLLTGVKMDFRRPPIFKKEESMGLKAPVYLILADDDVFIPPQKAMERCKKLFPNFKEGVMIPSKHIPDPGSFSLICEKIDKWMKD